jgi:hypothetical protein
MTTDQQFFDLPDPCGTFDEIFRAALKTLLDDLACARGTCASELSPCKLSRF